MTTALGSCDKLTLGKMNCSTGLYHIPFTRVPVLMALKRAVTTASCKNQKMFTHKIFMIFFPLTLNYLTFDYTEYFMTLLSLR